MSDTPLVPVNEGKQEDGSKESSDASLDDEGVEMSMEMVGNQIDNAINAALFKHAAKSVLGEEIDTCSYGRGYICQAVFACLTCSSLAPSASPIGVCLACVLQCHAGHQIEEVFEKRHFRCDCSTPRTQALNKCKFIPTLQSNPSTTLTDNVENQYNHNFSATYCYCVGSYKEQSDTMYACLFCEDWFHSHCLDTRETPRELQPFVCRNCVRNPKNSFLLPYFFNDPSNPQPPTTSYSSATTNSASAPLAGKDSFDLAGWQCSFCAYFNKPSDTTCFGCERENTALTKNGNASEDMVEFRNPSDSSLTPSLIPCTKLTELPSGYWDCVLCRCMDCLTINSEKIPWLYEEQIEDEEFEEEEEGPNEENISTSPQFPPPSSSSSSALTPRDANPDESASSDAQSFISSFLSSLPRAQVAYAAERVQLFKQSILDQVAVLVKESEDGKRIVNEEIVLEIIAKAKETERQKRKERDEGSIEEMKKRMRHEEYDE